MYFDIQRFISNVLKVWPGFFLLFTVKWEILDCEPRHVALVCGSPPATSPRCWETTGQNTEGKQSFFYTCQPLICFSFIIPFGMHTMKKNALLGMAQTLKSKQTNNQLQEPKKYVNSVGNKTDQSITLVTCYNQICS